MTDGIYKISQLQDALIRANEPTADRIRNALDPGSAYTIEAIAGLVGVTGQTVRRLAKTVGLVSFKYGSQTLYRLEATNAVAVVGRGGSSGRRTT